MENKLPPGLRGVLEQTPRCGGSYCSHEPIFGEEQSYSIGTNLADVFWLWWWTWASRPWTSSLETWVFVGAALLGGSAHAGGSICQETKGCWKHLFKNHFLIGLWDDSLGTPHSMAQPPTEGLDQSCQDNGINRLESWGGGDMTQGTQVIPFSLGPNSPSSLSSNISV